MTDHLNITTSGRGFDAFPAVPSEYGGHVSVSESSAAKGPHLWLRATEAMRGQPESKTALHLTAENAWRLADQLRAAVRDHYQGDATPDWAR
jgi:hypothetical protein